jgi:hypothetical protein
MGCTGSTQQENWEVLLDDEDALTRCDAQRNVLAFVGGEGTPQSDHLSPVEH